MKKLTAVLAALSILVTFFSASVSAAAKPSAPKITSVKNGEKGVIIKWKPVKNADGYYVYRKTPKVNYKKIANVKSASCVHKSAVSGSTYTYKVCAYNTGGRSKFCSQKSIKRVGTPAVKTSNTPCAIKVSWSKVKKATKYVLLGKKANAKKYTVLYRGTKTAFLYDNFKLNSEYKFKVKAAIGEQNGAYSSAKAHLFLDCPSIRADEPESMTGIKIQWEPVKNAEGYIIYRSIKSENSFKRIGKIKADSSTYLDEDVVSINSYSYYVTAYKGAYKSAKSNIASEVYGFFESSSVPLNLTIKKGEVYKDIYNKINSYGGVPYVTWTSAKPAVAKVNSKGVITGVKKGKAELTAVIADVPGYEGKTLTVTIIVTVK